MKKKILVTGGTGYIGSHTIVDLIENGFEVISIDNYLRSMPSSLQGIKNITGVEVKNYDVDMCKFDDLRNVFLQEKIIDGIIHFAALKTVPESIDQPLFYYENNMFSLINLMKCVLEFNIQNIVFSSSCSVYGNVKQLPVTENLPLEKPECPYASTKQMGERVFIDFVKRYPDFKVIMLRYFNPVGAHPSAEIGDNPIGKPNNLVPAITQTAIGLIEKLYVWGDDYDTRDGSCIRDYIHVGDIANAHTKALNRILENNNEENIEIYNLGSGEGISVIEAIKTFEKVNQISLNYEIKSRRAGDVAAIYADNEKAKSKLGWEIKYTLEDMMKSAWLWQLKLQ
ncbi:MAG: UDP-glucose 4-epimerase GalE, partial [Chitinophagaceae bacterium]|nr:UDP-glucose 4-epimerase GalE [Chitinophagaceae bacterium]